MFGDIIGAKSLNTTERVRHRSDTGCVDRLDLLDHALMMVRFVLLNGRKVLRP